MLDRAEREGVSPTVLLERLIIEGVDTLEHPGIVYRGPTSDRRAALAAGPDVWEIIARLRELDGDEEQRIATLAEESALHPRQIRIAVDYAAAHPDQVKERIERNERAAEDRAVVTENVAQFADERDVVLVFVHERSLPAAGAQAPALAELIDRWAADHPAPTGDPTGPDDGNRRSDHVPGSK